VEASGVLHEVSSWPIETQPEFMTLHGWTTSYGAWALDPSLKTIWSDRSASIRCNSNQVFEISYFGLADFLIDFGRRNIDIHSRANCSAETERHFLHDDILPRIIAHQGALVLHASAVLIDNSVVIFLGPSGGGKSSLAVSLHNAGHRLLGDDAIVVSTRHDDIAARAVYRSLRLYPDSIDALSLGTAHLTPVASYTDKRSIIFPDVEDADEPLPIRAAFLLGPPQGESISLQPMTPSEACMAFVEHSFWLDPLDLGRTKRRIVQASTLAEQIRCHRLSFPRDYAVLPSVHHAIVDVLD
jgi:hypothetical protein